MFCGAVALGEKKSGNNLLSHSSSGNLPPTHGLVAGIRWHRCRDNRRGGLITGPSGGFGHRYNVTTQNSVRLNVPS
jgi:hypothetical protein